MAAASPCWTVCFFMKLLVAAAKQVLIPYETMSIQVTYQTLTVAKEPLFRLQDGGLLIDTESPMPVATPLQVVSGEHRLSCKVRRVREGAQANMLLVPTEQAKLPRWLLGLGAEVGTGVEFEPEPVPVVVPPPVVEAAPVVVEPTPVVVEPTPVVEVAPTASPVETAATEPVAEAKPADGKPSETTVETAPSKQTPSETASGEEEDDESKAAKTSKTTAASRAKKKPRRR